MASLVAQMVKNPLAVQETWVGKIPWRRAWQPTPVFLPGESYGQRSLAGYSPQAHKESDMTEVTEHAHTHSSSYIFNHPPGPPPSLPYFSKTLDSLSFQFLPHLPRAQHNEKCHWPSGDLILSPPSSQPGYQVTHTHCNPVSSLLK